MNEVREMMVARVNGINEVLMEKGAGFQVAFTNNFKNNVNADGYNLIAEGKIVSPVVYYSDLWWSESDEEVADYLIRFNEEHKVEDGIVDVKECMRKDYILNHVLPRLYGESNIGAMEEHNRLYVKWLDMAIAYYVPIDSLSNDEGMASIPVTDDLIKTADVTLEEIQDAAINNMEELAEVKNMFEVIKGMMDIPEEEMCLGMPEMIVVTSNNGLNGASGLLCNGVREKLKHILGNTFYILPSSIHECICVNADDEEYLHSMVCEVNESVVTNADKLTDSVYKFENDEIIKVA